MQTFHLFCTHTHKKKKKPYFFYFTHIFLQNTHISLFIPYIYSIKYSFFYNFLLFPHSLPLSLTDLTLPMITPHPTTIITHPTTIIKESQPIQSGQINPSARLPTYQTTRNKGKPNHHPPNPKLIDQTMRNKRKPNQPHSTRNPLIKQRETKESDRRSEKLHGDRREIKGSERFNGFAILMI